MKTSTIWQAALCGLFAFIAFRGLNFDWKTILYTLLLCATILLALIFLRDAVGKRDKEKKDQPVFANKTVTIVLYEGQMVTGKLRCEPEECGEYVVLHDAVVEDESATIPKGEIYDVIAIPSSVVQMFKIEDLDKVK